MKTKKTETEKDLRKLKFCSRINKTALWVLTVTLVYGFVFAIILFAKIILSIIQLIRPEELISEILTIYSFLEEWLSGIMIALILISSLFILVYYSSLRIFEKNILRVMLNEKIKELYDNGKMNKHSTYIFKYFYRLYDSNKLKTELTSKQRDIFRALNEVFYADSFCLDDMEGFNYDLFNKSFKDILIDLCKDSTPKGIDDTITKYKKELDSKKIKKLNKTFWKIQNQITINLYLFLFKTFLLVTMIAWLFDNIINHTRAYGPIGGNYFNICAVVLLGIDIWERRGDLFFLRNMDEIEMKDKKEK
ncbi:hypothetical protein SAMN04487760_105101 [Lachnospiraceae bacterium G41]|nr:hypothetical protein SAMN04487760_105101 [Lachnospiraceae bacterium G41]